MADADRCVMCGRIIPEGRMICPLCDRDNKNKFRVDKSVTLSAFKSGSEKTSARNTKVG